MDTFYQEIVEKYEHPWVIFSIICEMYNKNIYENVEIEDGLKANWVEFRSFLIHYKCKQNIIQPKILKISKQMKDKLDSYLYIVEKIDKNIYESFILYSSFLSYMCNENVHFLFIDFINFDNIALFCDSLRLLQQNKISITNLRYIFKKYIYDDIYEYSEKDAESIIKFIYKINCDNVIVKSKKLKIHEEFIQNYIKSQKYKFDDELIYKICNSNDNFKLLTVSEIFNLINYFVKTSFDSKMKTLTLMSTSSELETLMSCHKSVINTFLIFFLKIKEVGNFKTTKFYNDLATLIINSNVEMKNFKLSYFMECNKRRNDDSDSDSE